MTADRVAVAAASLAATAALLAGCGALPAAGDSPPTASVSAVRFERLTPEGVTLVLDAVIENPFADPLRIAGIEYALSIAGTPILEGEALSPEPIPGRGEAIVAVPIAVEFGAARRSATGFAPGALVSYAVEAAVLTADPNGQTIRVPLRSEGLLPAPLAPDVTVPVLRWETLRLDLAAAVVEFRVANPNAFEIDLDRFAYTLDLAQRAAASGTLVGAGRVDPGGAKTIPVRITFVPEDLGEGAFARLQGAATSYAVRGEFLLRSPFGDWRARFAGAGDAAAR